MSMKYKYLSIALLVLLGLGVLRTDVARASPNGLLFPVIGSANYSDTFLAYRAGQVSNKHHAIDIFAAKHSHIVSPVDGTVRYVGYPQDSWGWYVVIVDDDGYEYHFMHVNNDTPGTDDGQGGPMHAYGPDLFGQYNYGSENASRVAKGQLLGYVGDSGNAENTPPHLHFEIIKPEYTQMNYSDIPLEGFVNPFEYLNNAEHTATPAVYPALRGEILPYGPSVRVETNVAKGSLDVDPELEVVSGAGPGGGPHVKVFNPENSFTGREFYAYDSSFMGGVDVAAGDINGDGKDEIITGAGKGGGPHVKAFDSSGAVTAEFFAYVGTFNGGVKVSAGEAIAGSSRAEIAVSPWSDGSPHIKVLDSHGVVLKQGMHLEPWWSGYYDVAAGGGTVNVSTGLNRRSSIRTAF